MNSRELLTAAITYATVAGRAVRRRGDVRRSVADELAALNARDPLSMLRLRDGYAAWPSGVLIRATATELLRSRWQRDPAAFDAVFSVLHEQLSALRSPARSVVSRRRSVATQAVEA